jgi:hypothetical protein
MNKPACEILEIFEERRLDDLGNDITLRVKYHGLNDWRFVSLVRT